MRMKDILDKRKNKTKELLEVKPNEGPIMKAFKFFWGCKVWRLPHERFLSKYFQIGKNCEKDYHDDETADPYIKKAVEVYWLLSGSLLVVLYLATFYVTRTNCSWPFVMRAIVASSAALISLYRAGEIIATLIHLHIFKRYETSNPRRALMLGLFGYIQTALVFGTAFLTEAFLLNDSYNKTSICEGVLDGLYFSVVTIVTLGYGDSCPDKWLGKLFVVTEVFVGIFLIVVVIQKVVTGSPQSEQKNLNHM